MNFITPETKELYDELISTIRTYRPDTSLEMVERAFAFAHEAHITQRRKTGEPYIVHPLKVAIILAEIRTDLESIAAGLLHDVVEDTPTTHEDIVAQFGEDVAHLVDGVTKIKKVAYVSKTERQAENYRKMFFKMSQDVRVLLIKIADRLHNMRTLSGFTNEDKQREVAQETLDIYAPLAHRLGIAKLRYELEDLGFRYTNRDFYYDLAKKVEIKLSERTEIVEQLMKEIRARLEKEGIPAQVEGRAKRFYSIYKKMVGKNKTLDELYDLYAVRVLVQDVSECYEVLGQLHEMYTPIPDRFKDYIGMKKANGYQSLHTALNGPGEPFEVQIRTFDMHSVAQYGIAAHWKYKEGGKAEKDKWLQDIMDLQRSMSDSDDFLDALKFDLSAFQSHIYCFTPKGDIHSLPDGSCPVDFAYAIHSELGHRTVGAKVEGKIVPLDHVLHSGDRVEILTSQATKGPHKDWLTFVKTPSARAKITQWFNKEGREENLRKGREALENAAKEHSLTFDVLLQDGREASILERFQCKDLEQLYFSIGVGGLKERTVVNYLTREYEKTLPPPSDDELIKALLETAEKSGNRKSDNGVLVKGIGYTDVRYARCCNPLPGDEIVGYITRGRGITVHRTDCVNILAMDELDLRRLTKDVYWPSTLKPHNTYHVELRIVCSDRNSLLADVSHVISEEKVRITSAQTRTIQGEAIFHFGIEVEGNQHLEIVTKKINNVSGVHEITRVASSQ